MISRARALLERVLPRRAKLALASLATRALTPSFKEPLDPRATRDDLYHCYRLLLGRNPDEGGWRSRLPHILRGMTVEALVELFLQSEEFANRSGKRAPAQLVQLDRFSLYVDPNDFSVGRTLRQSQSYEPHVSALIARELRPAATFVDVGASIGYYSLLAASIVGSEGHVHAFEPGRANCGLLYASARENGFENISIVPAAVAERRGLCLYVASAGNGQISELSDETALSGAGEIVQTLSLDEALAGTQAVDLIKLDIEGAEHRALRGASEVLARDRPVIVSELGPRGLQTVSGVDVETYLELFRQHDYGIAVIERKGQEHPCASAAEVLARLPASLDHIDIVARPR